VIAGREYPPGSKGAKIAEILHPGLVHNGLIDYDRLGATPDDLSPPKKGIDQILDGDDDDDNIRQKSSLPRKITMAGGPKRR
jgi:hypothetical protein